MGKMFFPKTPPELGSRLVFWRRGLGARVAGQCPSRARPVPVPRGSSLSSTRNAHFSENVALVYAKRTFCSHPFVPRRSRLRETVILT